MGTTGADHGRTAAPARAETEGRVPSVVGIARSRCCSRVGGAGGIRTLVRRVRGARATTVPAFEACRYLGPGCPRRHVFPVVQSSFRPSTGLSRSSTTASVAGLRRSDPACHHWSRCEFTRLLAGARRRERTQSRCWRLCFFAPFNEPEQLGSHDAAHGPHVETSQPLVKGAHRWRTAGSTRSMLPAAAPP